MSRLRCDLCPDSSHSGEGGIRTPDGLIAHTGFRDRRIQPLCHLSGGAGLKVVEGGPEVAGAGPRFSPPAYRRGAKKERSRSAQSSARRPLSTCGRWFSRGSSRTLNTLPAAPALGSVAPNTSRGRRARTIAPAHIAHGSSVTYMTE